ncbi:MAG: DUF58 domain-containing protein [Planctomycetota bacterium]
MIHGSTEPVPSTREELIGPELAGRLDRLDLRSLKMFPGALPGERRSKRRGSSVEFDDYRNYVPGDDLRHIDWNVYARMDKLFLKLFREEEDLSLTVVVDASPSMLAGKPTKLVCAHRLAMAIAHVGLVGNNRVSLTGFGSPAGYRRLAPGRGRRRLAAVGEFLLENLRDAAGSVQPAKPARADGAGAGFNDTLRRVARERTGKGVVIVLSDCLVRGGYQPGIATLADTGRGGFDTTVLQVLSPGELDPAAEGERLSGDLRLTDAESGADAEITVTAELIERYRERARRYCDELGAFCRSRRIRHALITTDTPPDAVVLGTLRRLGVLG